MSWRACVHLLYCRCSEQVYGDTAAAFGEGGNTSTGYMDVSPQSAGYMDVAPQSAFDVARDSDEEDV